MFLWRSSSEVVFLCTGSSYTLYIVLMTVYVAKYRLSWESTESNPSCWDLEITTWSWVTLMNRVDYIWSATAVDSSIARGCIITVHYRVLYPWKTTNIKPSPEISAVSRYVHVWISWISSFDICWIQYSTHFEWILFSKMKKKLRIFSVYII